MIHPFMPTADPIKILLVDDRPDKLLAIEAVLAPLQLHLVKATSGHTAVELASKTEFAVILLDVRMPGMDGFEAAARIRSQPGNRHTPLLFISAMEDEELIRKGYALGAVDYIRELRPEILRAKVAVFVDLYRKSTDLTERRRVERQLRAQYTIINILAEAEKPEDAFTGVLEVLGKSFDWEWAAWWRMETDGLVCTASWHDPACSAEKISALSRVLRLRSGEGLPGRVQVSGEAVWITELGKDSNFVRQTAAAREGWRSAVGFPVIVGGQIEGVIECFSQTTRTQDQSVLDALEAVGRSLGQTFARKHIEARRHAMLEASLDCIITIDHEDRILEWNPAAERTFGYSRAEAVGKSMSELIIPTRLREAHLQGLRRLLQTGQGALLGKRIELPALRANGSEFLAEIAIIQIRDGGSPLFTGYVRDITERKRAEELLRSAKQEAETANRTKDQFLAALSHELRTPLTPVVALLPTLLENVELPEQVREDLSMVKRNVELEARLIDDLLDLTRIAKGKLLLNLQHADTRVLLDHTLQIVRGEAAEKRISIHRELNAEAPYIWGDPTRLQQVFWNLLKNAVKFTPEGGDIWISSHNPDATKTQITVRDNGVGIAPERLERVFDLFEQSGAPTEVHRFGGLGLGLFIAKGIIEQHGGKIEAHSEGRGCGSVFSVTLPAVAQPNAQAEEKPTLGRTLAERSLRILLLEDHAQTRDVLARLLTRKGHEVRTAETVREALEVADAERFDLIVSDIGLPDGSGLDVMQKLKSRYGLRGIALSGFGMESDVLRSREAGFSAHLVKPIDFRQLENTLRALSSE